MDLIIEIPKDDYTIFQIKLLKNEDYETVLYYDVKEQALTFDKSIC